ncbi:hypothetical protein Nepgr_015869 [Nepenthes gracilis]|uniref:Uncharacterized protein n=1 Tax=Nepenthes gracilis TaxID=150966 RepID=A0AAD3SLR6_NEPGR|nr:hypothetical protein Nepgr_015869 [Nepenthes gracilis]
MEESSRKNIGHLVKKRANRHLLTNIAKHFPYFKHRDRGTKKIEASGGENKTMKHVVVDRPLKHPNQVAKINFRKQNAGTTKTKEPQIHPAKPLSKVAR